MKTLKITLLAAIFCTTLTGLSVKGDTNTDPIKEQITKKDEFSYSFTVKRHVRKGQVPSNG
jgi:hypothetical protein